MKKLNKLIALFAVGTIGFTSCEDIKFGNSFLEKPTSNTITIDTVFSSEYYSNQLLADCYNSLPDYTIVDGRLQWSVLETQTDLADKCNGISVYQSNTITSTAENERNHAYLLSRGSMHVNDPIYGIRKACIYMENVHKVPDMSEELKKRRKGEALMVKAYHYVEMFRYMGPMPIMEKAFEANDDTYMERPTVEDFVNRVVAMCDEAAVLLDGYWTVPAEDAGRFTQAAAKALKFRFLLHAASPLYNSDEPLLADSEACQKHITWYGNYDQARWQRALDAGVDFLNSNAGQYKLVGEGAGLSAQNHADFKTLRDNYMNGYHTRYNGELIIEGHRFDVYNTGAKWCAQYRYSNFQPSIHLHNMYEMVDGTEFDWNNTDHAANPFWNSMTFAELKKGAAFDAVARRDPRLYETLIVNGSDVQGKRLELVCQGTLGKPVFPKKITTIKIDNAGKSGMAMRKYVRDYGSEIKNKPYSCPLMRIPEIYLGMAECLNVLGGTADGKDAWDFVNIVRGRVGMPAISSATHAQGDALLHYILDERAREFAYEEVRYHDIRRYKRDDIMIGSVNQNTNKGEGLIVIKEGNEYTYASGLPLANTRMWCMPTAWNTKKFYFTPICDDQINLEYGLIQNPGW